MAKDNDKIDDKKVGNFAQLFNDLNRLKSEMRNVSVTSNNNITSKVLDLISQYAGNVEAQAILAAILSKAEFRDSKVFHNKVSYIIEQNKDLADLSESEEDKLKKIEKAKYLAYRAFAKELKESYKAEEHALGGVTERARKGEDIPQHELDGAIKTPEQVKKEAEQYNAMQEYYKELDKRTENLNKEEEDLDAIIRDTKKTAEEKLQAQEKKSQVKLKKEEYKEVLDVVKADKNFIEEKFNSCQNQIIAIEEIARELPANDSRKMKFKNFAQLKKEELEAVKGNKDLEPSKDREEALIRKELKQIGDGVKKELENQGKKTKSQGNNSPNFGNKTVVKSKNGHNIIG